ncbi:unnamed protein product [Urochloa humidicola]
MATDLDSVRGISYRWRLELPISEVSSLLVFAGGNAGAKEIRMVAPPTSSAPQLHVSIISTVKCGVPREGAMDGRTLFNLKNYTLKRTKDIESFFSIK